MVNSNTTQTPQQIRLPLNAFGLWIGPQLAIALFMLIFPRIADFNLLGFIIFMAGLVLAEGLIYATQAWVLSKFITPSIFKSWIILSIGIHLVLRWVIRIHLLFPGFPGSLISSILIASVQYRLMKKHGYTMHYWILIHLLIYGVNEIVLVASTQFGLYEFVIYSQQIIISSILSGLALFLIKPNPAINQTSSN
ncbi:hypothetical protein [Herpetosiphon llansteffanensis]|uniref:hypothetical protein n=1 Tax=Herpetosiphon llansteffanensis TaxID=2094568 RepID=UPI000D7C753A|nr:hypothetical protein [Herpetosiphon llansteffanensis]